MSNTPFPKEAELRNWASRGMEANGYLSIDRMPRLRAAAIAAEEQAKVLYLPLKLNLVSLKPQLFVALVQLYQLIVCEFWTQTALCSFYLCEVILKLYISLF